MPPGLRQQGTIVSPTQILFTVTQVDQAKLFLAFFRVILQILCKTDGPVIEAKAVDVLEIVHHQQKIGHKLFTLSVYCQQI